MSETMADGDAPMRDTHIDTDDDTTTTMTATTMTTTKRQLLVARARQLDCPNTFNGCSSLFSVAACAKARAAATAAPRYTCSVHVCNRVSHVSAEIATIHCNRACIFQPNSYRIRRSNRRIEVQYSMRELFSIDRSISD